MLEKQVIHTISLLEFLTIFLRKRMITIVYLYEHLLILRRLPC